MARIDPDSSTGLRSRAKGCAPGWGNLGFPVHLRGRWDEIPPHTPHRRWPRLSIRERFDQYVEPEPNSGCHLWVGAVIQRAGYGQFSIEGRPVLVHRLAYEMEVGPIDDGLVIDHLCRNKLCVNPRHLEPVRYAQNLARGHNRSNDLVIAEFCRRGHPRSENRRSWASCRTCNLEWQRSHPKRGKRALSSLSPASGAVSSEGVRHA